MLRNQQSSVSSQLYECEEYSSPANALREEVTPKLSFVVPVMNEEDTLEELFNGIRKNVAAIGPFELIFIDDGSTDSSWSVIQALSDIYPENVRGLRFRCNRGKAAALQVGFEAARGEIVFTMDADLQDDPAEIPRFLEKLEEGFDLVSGWKAVRHDPWHKVLPSRVFNRMLSHFSGVRLHDHNCGFKCYRNIVAKSVRLFGELHRMVPSLAGMHGFKVTEIVVQHHARKFGKSKYGIERFIRGFSDMLTIGFLRKYHERPSHFANFCAVNYIGLGLIVAALGFLGGIGSVTNVLCLLTGLLLGGMGLACTMAGLFTELLIRQGHHILSSVVNDTELKTDKRKTRVTKDEKETVSV